MRAQLTHMPAMPSLLPAVPRLVLGPTQAALMMPGILPSASIKRAVDDEIKSEASITAASTSVSRPGSAPGYTQHGPHASRPGSAPGFGRGRGGFGSKAVSSSGGAAGSGSEAGYERQVKSGGLEAVFGDDEEEESPGGSRVSNLVGGNINP